jgi:hypothetical protein
MRGMARVVALMIERKSQKRRVGEASFDIIELCTNDPEVLSARQKQWRTPDIEANSDLLFY